MFINTVYFKVWIRSLLFQYKCNFLILKIDSRNSGQGTLYIILTLYNVFGVKTSRNCLPCLQLLYWVFSHLHEADENVWQKQDTGKEVLY